MHVEDLKHWEHSHTFGQDQRRPGEIRTLIVIAITATMMIIEIAAGARFGSMALLADGLHMGSHAVALSITAFAYVYARRHAHDRRFSFGTGKMNALGGFTGAILLAGFALTMVWESVNRLLFPEEIAFNQAILVAIIGLVVNGASMFILGHEHPHHDHDHEHHDHHHHHHHHHDHDHHDHHHQDHDHNLRSAYLHVLADALTSFLAIFALLAAKYAGLLWMDPVMGVVGAILVSKWSIGLLRSTSGVLLDKEGPEHIRNSVREALEGDGESRIADLHLWSIGPNIYSLIVSMVSHHARSSDYYRERLPRGIGLEHVTIEVHQCSGDRHRAVQTSHVQEVAGS